MDSGQVIAELSKGGRLPVAAIRAAQVDRDTVACRLGVFAHNVYYFMLHTHGGRTTYAHQH